MDSPSGTDVLNVPGTRTVSFGNGKPEQRHFAPSGKDGILLMPIDDLWHTADGWNDASDRTGYNFVDLFSGAGGLSCGLAMAGLNPVASVEIMDVAASTYARNFSKKGFDGHVETGDIRLPETKERLYGSVEGKHIHLIAGGFPCQGFSMAGNRIVDDPRNGLYKEMKEIVRTLRPETVVMENVEGILSMLDGKVMEKIIGDYRDIGYKVDAALLNSADYGVPQTRRRVIFVGNRIGMSNYHPEPIVKDGHYATLGSAIAKFMNIPDDPSINHVRVRHSPEIRKRMAEVPEGKSLYPNYTETCMKSPWNKPSCTIKGNHGCTNIHPKEPRCLTARECAALQSFPDDFIFEGSKGSQLLQIGNAVPPLLGKAVGLTVRKMLDCSGSR